MGGAKERAAFFRCRGPWRVGASLFYLVVLFQKTAKGSLIAKNQGVNGAKGSPSGLRLSVTAYLWDGSAMGKFSVESS